MHRRVALISALVAVSGLAGCGQGRQASGEHPVARVGDEVITEAELQRALSAVDSADAETALALRGQVVDSLIDQRLLSRAARDEKLDALPEVRLAIEDAQRKVLGDAYMARRYKDLKPPTDTEISDYYLRHPELFAERRLYHMRELELNLSAARLSEVETRIRQSRDFGEFLSWLKLQGIRTHAREAIEPAEQIPMNILAQLKNLQNGQVIVQVLGKQRIRIVQLISSQPQQITPEQAHGAIVRVLEARARKARLDSEIKTLRRDEKIEYVQGFSPLGMIPAAAER